MSSTRSFRKEEIAEKTVIDSSGRIIGKVKDLTFTLDGSITLIVERQDGSALHVPLNRVMGVSDHVVIKDDNSTQRSAATGAPTQMTAAGTSAPAPGMVACKYCGALAKQGTQWCPGCGRSLA